MSGTPIPLPEPPSPPAWRAQLRRLLVTGLLILAPVALTVFVLVQLFRWMDGIFAPLVDGILAAIFERPVHVPGLGLLLTFLVVLLLGWLSTRVAGRRLLRSMEGVIRRVPVAKSIYGATKGILEAVSADQTEAFKRVVLVEYPKANLFAIGFVTTGARWEAVDERLADLLLVFVPTTPNPTSGFLLMVPRREAIDVPITVEEGIRMVISGGLLMPQPRVPDVIPPVPPTGSAATTPPTRAPAASAGER
ncbi:MAG TPA: DUF502 domain-containing protein [Thermoanaerobaculia bacterium]|nr:DUF502 domain-containing protein [Thermoanaerobaculia bacterium]